MGVLLQIAGSSSLERFPLENLMDSSTAQTPYGMPIIRITGPCDDGLPPTEPIVIILALLAVVTGLAFSLLSTIGPALP